MTARRQGKKPQHFFLDLFTNADRGQIEAAGSKGEFKAPFLGDAVLYLHRARE
jgi:hypothetical protein